MTTRQRIDLLAHAYPRLFPRKELLQLVRDQLGHVDALDCWIARDRVRVRARAPRLIHHVCAGNLAVSAITSIVHGLLLGARNSVKLPSPRDDSTARREIIAFGRSLPRPLRDLVTFTSTRDSSALDRADVVIAFGSDATMAALRAQLHGDQQFIAHGHAVSVLWLADPGRLTAREARACAIDVLTYDQLGCLRRRRFTCHLALTLKYSAVSSRGRWKRSGDASRKNRHGRSARARGSQKRAMSRMRWVIVSGFRRRGISAGR